MRFINLMYFGNLAHILADILFIHVLYSATLKKFFLPLGLLASFNLCAIKFTRLVPTKMTFLYFPCPNYSLSFYVQDGRILQVRALAA